MEKRSAIWNFNEVNYGKRISVLSKLMIVSLVLMFLVTPLSTMSPETFVIPKSILYVPSCGCLVPCY